MKYFSNITELIGKTPLLKINLLNPEKTNNLFAKLEFFNPLHSVKDRAAFGMIKRALEEGKIKEGSTVIEPTSGNTGISLAWLSRIFKFRLIIVMPENMSVERRKILEFFEAEVILTSKESGMMGAVEKAKKILRENPDYFMPMQFENYANADYHYKTTGPEIWNDLEGRIDIFISGVGTGGTITGVGRYLKEKNKNIKIIAVEPLSSPFLSEGVKGAHKIQGIGAGFKPEILDSSIIDEIIKVSDDEAKEFSKKLAVCEGIFAGLSSGAAAYAAYKISEQNTNKNIVFVLPDTAERYMSTYLFE
ncbi:MAG: cysteine synthase A [Elusimicrobiales bacterium]